MLQEQQVKEFAERLRQAAGDNLRSMILYGSATSNEFHSEFSNINLLCILNNTSFAALSALSPAVEWWNSQKHSAPLVLTSEELQRSTDVFAIEFLDMRQQYHVLYGEDVLAGLQVPMTFHRMQIEYELREKLILLREHLLTAGKDPQRLWALMLRSLPSFTTLFRHILIELGQPIPSSKRETLKALSAKMYFDSSAFLHLLDIRERKAETKQFDAADVCTRYLAAIEQVTSAVDTMWSSGQQSS